MIVTLTTSIMLLNSNFLYLIAFPASTTRTEKSSCNVHEMFLKLEWNMQAILAKKLFVHVSCVDFSDSRKTHGKSFSWPTWNFHAHYVNIFLYGWTPLQRHKLVMSWSTTTRPVRNHNPTSLDVMRSNVGMHDVIKNVLIRNSLKGQMADVLMMSQVWHIRNRHNDVLMTSQTWPTTIQDAKIGTHVTKFSWLSLNL